jgi:F-type H+-transporting ATPase subunit b
MDIFSTAEFWVAVSFAVFAGLLVYYRVPGMIARALDLRAEAIERELADAQHLREEAQALLADYQRRSREAETEAQSIVEQAKREADALAEESRVNLIAQIERRTRMAEEKIARAESQAIADVRAAAVEAALAAAERVLKARVAGGAGAVLTDQAIAELPGKLN